MFTILFMPTRQTTDAVALKLFLAVSVYQKSEGFQIRLKLTEWWAIISVAVICNDLKTFLKINHNF